MRKDEKQKQRQKKMNQVTLENNPEAEVQKRQSMLPI